MIVRGRKSDWNCCVVSYLQIDYQSPWMLLYFFSMVKTTSKHCFHWLIFSLYSFAISSNFLKCLLGSHALHYNSKLTLKLYKNGVLSVCGSPWVWCLCFVQVMFPAAMDTAWIPNLYQEQNCWICSLQTVVIG